MEYVPRSRFQAENWNKINDTSIMEDIQNKLLFNALYSYNYLPELSFLELFEKENFVKKYSIHIYVTFRRNTVINK
jgi:hypothetical protein